MSFYSAIDLSIVCLHVTMNGSSLGIVQYKVSSLELFQKYLFRILDNANALQWTPVVIPLALLEPNALLMDQVNRVPTTVATLL